ncbi:MAG: lysine--tRNA ligase [bacterium]
MIWVDRVAQEIINRSKKLEWVDDMKTPSGRVHMGSLRGVVVHDLVYKVLKENNINTKFSYVFDDHDPMDAIPSYLEYKKWEKYAGMQLYKIPSPIKGFKSFAHYYADEYIKVFNSINCHPQIIWGSQLYNSGKMNGVIKIVLDNSEKIRKIYNKAFDKKKPNDWHPYNVVCKKCNKIGTSYVYKWDGNKAHYRCEPKAVAWAVGCGNKGSVSPYDGNGKLPWRVDWPAKWMVIGVTIEGAGKDHMSAGGSYEIAEMFCKKILKYPAPYPVAYEFFNLKGKKMSSSKGLGISAREISEIVPSNILRFIIVRTPIKKAIDFDTDEDTINKVFDDYDICLNAYFDTLENKVPEGKQGEVILDFARIIKLSEVKPLPKKRILIPRFRTLVNLLRNNEDPLVFFEKQKQSNLTQEEKNLLQERVNYAKPYIKQNKSNAIIELSSNQLKFLKLLAEKLETLKIKDSVSIQNAIFLILKESDLTSKEAFQGFYKSLIGKESGPKASDLIISIGLPKVIQSFKR